MLSRGNGRIGNYRYRSGRITRPVVAFELLELRRLLSGAGERAAADVELAHTRLQPAWIIPTIGITYHDNLLVSRDGRIAGSLARFLGKLEAGDYTAVIDWGDGHVSAGVVTGRFNYSVEGEHTYARPGDYTVSIIIRASDGVSEGVRTPVKPFADEITLTRLPQLDNSRAYPTTEQFIGGFADAEPAELSAYSVMIDWGDGTQTAGRIYASGPGTSTFAVAGTHDYAAAGTYPLTYTITKQVGDSSMRVAARGDAIIHSAALQPGDVRPYNGVSTTRFTPLEDDPEVTEPPASARPQQTDVFAGAPERSTFTAAHHISSVAADLFADEEMITDFV